MQHLPERIAKGILVLVFRWKNTREETLKGMTFGPLILILKKRKGSLEVGKWADFVLFDKDIMKIEESEVLKMKPASTYLKGMKVK
jgi:predicted amidohydrolase YtcJ